ncbi:MAG TPA: hypothetical protein VH188_08150 [Chthoniobacterales bacterium]|jgi:hypothetical protein|nr:hypothetical protein [Chthoniobacterales bacterium]
MKTCLLVLCLIATAASSVFAETYRAPVVRQKQKQTPERKAPPLERAPVGGAIPRGVRGGNFFQMFNPKAPAKYGTSQESITYDPNNPSKITGVKLFVFQF